MIEEQDVTEQKQDCVRCRANLEGERLHLFHYIMGIAWYSRATYEQVTRLIDCYSQMYADKSAEVEMLRTINEIELKN